MEHAKSVQGISKCDFLLDFARVQRPLVAVLFRPTPTRTHTHLLLSLPLLNPAAHLAGYELIRNFIVPGIFLANKVQSKQAGLQKGKGEMHSEC